MCIQMTILYNIGVHAFSHVWSLVVTPVKKTCKRKDSKFQKCGYRSSCVKKELFCYGRVNCAWPDREPRGKQYFILLGGLTVVKGK